VPLTYDQAHDNITAKEEGDVRFLRHLKINGDAHSKSPAAGPAAFISSYTSARMLESENQIASQFPLTPATETMNFNSNYPGMTAQQLPDEQREQNNMGLFGFQPIHREFAPSATPSAHGESPTIQNYPGDYFMPGTVDNQWAPQATMAGPSSEFEGGLPPVPLPAPRSEVWTTAQENHLKESKRNGKTYPEIRHSMWVAFGIDRSVNVLSKRYRMMLERDAKDNVSCSYVQDLDSETPNIKGLGHYEAS
jgi:hypothetical protein